MSKVTLSVIKADVGSIGGHTKPSEPMLEAVRSRVRRASANLLLDGLVTCTGDDIAIIMSHRRGVGAPDIHHFAWDCFLAATEEAKAAGLYGAGQDLLVDAPSGNVRGAGPAVAEIEFIRDPRSKDRPAEAFLVFAADKCGPGAYNHPLYSVFCDPMHNGGLLLNPKMHQGFQLTIIDMDHNARDSDRVVRLDVPERGWDVACLLQNPDRSPSKRSTRGTSRTTRWYRFPPRGSTTSPVNTLARMIQWPSYARRESFLRRKKWWSLTYWDISSPGIAAAPTSCR